ncbi:MAG: glycosyltransferase family 4 protein [Thermostichales cyanobacterium SZTDM-1c_bins_54]
MARFLFVSTPAAALGSGAGGGIELNVINLSRQLQSQGHTVHVLAPAGSRLPGIPLTTATGLPGSLAPIQPRDLPIQVLVPSVLCHLWELAFQMQRDFDVVVNWSYDWLPLYLTSFFQVPVAHVISQGSLTNALDTALQQVVERFPGTVAVHSHAQSGTFRFAQASLQAGRDPFVVLPCGIDLSQYIFVARPQDESVCWVGRISPEKGLEDCAALAQSLGQPVQILGRMQDVDYWYRVRRAFPQAPLKYRGFFPTQDMQAILGQCRALLMTPKWVESFGIVVVEALACGVPVITYRRGGPAEIIEDGKTGFVVDPDNIEHLQIALGQIGEIDRHHCRRVAEEKYSLTAMTESFLRWMGNIIP